MTFRPLTALALIAVIATGCSETPTETETGSATETAAPKSKAVRFSECMRENGVSEFPDPEPSGELTIDGVLNGSSLDSGIGDVEAGHQRVQGPAALGVHRAARPRPRSRTSAWSSRSASANTA